MEHLISDLFRNSLYFSKKHAKEPFGPALNWFSPVPKGSLQEGGVYIKFKKLAFWWKVLFPSMVLILQGKCVQIVDTL